MNVYWDYYYYYYYFWRTIFSISSLNFYYKWCLLRLFASLGCLNLRFVLMKGLTEKYLWVIIDRFFFCLDAKETKDQAWKSKAQKLPQSAVPQPEPFAFQAQLADCCHFTFSLFFYAFYLRAGEEFSVMGSRFLVLGFSEEVCDFHFTPALKGAGNSELDVVSTTWGL